MSNHKVEEKDHTKIKEWPSLALKGFLMGSADVVPGVSGGTMALITGVYERLLGAISSVNAHSLKSLLKLDFPKFFQLFHWKFFLGLMSGIFGAVIFFTKIVPLQVWMYKEAEMIYGLFFGLIIASIVILAKSIKKKGLAEGLSLILGALIGFWIVNLVPAETPEHPVFIFLSGMIAICAMILPGISGSYLLLMLRKYEFILGQISELGGPQTLDAFVTLVPFGLGAVLGILLFSRVLKWLLKRYHNQTMALLIGFLIGSLYVIWPFQQREFVRITKTEIVASDNPFVLELKDQEVDTLVAKFTLIEQLQNGQFKLTEVKKKQLSVKPYLPSTKQNTGNFGILWLKGLGGILLGLFLVTSIEFIRAKNP